MNVLAQGSRSGSSRGRHWLAVAALVAGGLSSTSVGAQTQTTPDAHGVVLLLTDTPGDPFLGKIQAEISSLGLEVIVRAPQGSIETSARAAHAVAAVRMLPSRNGVEVWMADATSGRSLLRQTVVDEAPGGPNQNVVALQTAELLRTSLLRHAQSASPKPETVKAVPVLVHVAPPPSGENGLAASLGLLHGGGGASPAWQVGASYRYVWNAGFGLALNFSAPLFRGSLSATEGSADVGAILAGGGVLARFESKPARFVFMPGLGAALVAVLTKGHPDPSAGPQLISNSSTAYTGLAYVSVAVGWKASSWLRLGASGLGGATTSRVRVRFAGSDAGAWGTPVLGANLFGEVAWR